MLKKSVFLSLILCAFLFSQEEKNLSNQFQAGAIGVTIGGNFVVTGTFPSYVNERLDQFVTRIYNQARENILSRSTEPEVMREMERNLERYSLRNIKLKRSSGEELKIDLMNFRRTGDFANNPYLRHDDVIIFPLTDLERNFFTVSGAVMDPGKFHYFEGDKLSDAMDLSGGINLAYENPSVKIYRLNYTADKIEQMDVTNQLGYELQRGDRIVVEAEETEKKELNILVLGEVNNPGRIPITKTNTSLKDVLERAGGIKNTASLKNSRLYTGSTAAFILERIYGIQIDKRANYSLAEERLTNNFVSLEHMMMYRLSSLTEEDTAYFSIENQLRVLTEGSAVDFGSFEEKSGALATYYVKDGDILIIPSKQTTIYLFGSVVNPGHVNFEPGKDAWFYINKAGGLGEFAEEDEIMVIKGSSRKWISLEVNPDIEEGDYIYIPRDEPRTFNYYVEVASRYLSILGSAATVILLLVQFGK